jgi:hypothetical protein
MPSSAFPNELVSIAAIFRNANSSSVNFERCRQNPAGNQYTIISASA